MKTMKIENPGKVYVVTRKSKSGSSGTSKGGKVCITRCFTSSLLNSYKSYRVCLSLLINE